MKRFEMKIVVGRFKDGTLKVVKILEDEDSNFRKSDNSECLRYDHKKDEIEILLMTDWWNQKHHEGFERWWSLRESVLDGESEKTI